VLLIIIGAGGSYDSSPDKPPPLGPRGEGTNRPPLANDLFADVGAMRATRLVFPQINQIIPQLIPRSGRSIEESLHRLEAEATENPRRHVELAAVRYYLQVLFHNLVQHWLAETHGVTNYQGLLGRIVHFSDRNPGPVLLVTFNYDTLLEHALTSEFRVGFKAIDDYISSSDFKLFKLHGSANWGRNLNELPDSVSNRLMGRGNADPWAFRDDLIMHAAGLSISDTYQVTGSGMPFSGPPLYPAIAIPVRFKSAFECPANHLGLLQSLIPKVTKIITVGWRGAEQDFLNLLHGGLRGSPRAVEAVSVAASSDEAEDTMNLVCGSMTPIRPQGCFGGFSDTVAELAFDPLLKM
jgi:hypothetical protein